MSDEIKDVDSIIGELEEQTYASVTYILTTLAKNYQPRVEDTLALNNALVKQMATMLGEMVACYPDDEQDAIHDIVVERMVYAQEMMNLELADQDKQDNNPNPEKWDLASMKPEGSC